MPGRRKAAVRRHVGTPDEPDQWLIRRLIAGTLPGVVLGAAAPAATSATRSPGKAGSKAQAAFQRGLTALTQWVEQEGQRPVPRNTIVHIAVDGETEPVPVRLGVWLSNTRARRDRLTPEQLDALRALAVGWA